MKILIKTKGDAIFLAVATMSGIVLTFILTFAAIGYNIYLMTGGKPLDPLNFTQSEQRPIAEVMGRDQLSILVIGSDAHLKYDPGRSDTIIWALLDFKRHEVNVVSIPRDMLVRVPSKKGGYFDKICHAYSYGGPDLVQKSVEGFLGVDVDQVIRVDYNGFVKIVDTLGGVEVDVEKDMDYDDNAGDLHIHLKKGKQVLDGLKSLEYVRYRHDARGDLARIERQQKFLDALKNKGLKLNQVGKIRSLARIITESIYLSPGNDDEKQLGPMEVFGLLNFFLQLDDGSIHYHSVPVKADVIYNKLSSLVPDYTGLDKMMRGIFEVEDETPSKIGEVASPALTNGKK